jgi:hypothetical protein
VAGGHCGGHFRVEFHAVLERVHARGHALASTGQIARVRGHLDAAGMGRGDDGSKLGARPGRDAGLGAVQVELQEICPVVELAERQRQQLVGILRFDRSFAGHRSGPIDPCARGSHMREARPAAPAIPDSEAEGPDPAVNRIGDPRRTYVARPADAGAGHEPAVRLGDGQKPLGRIVYAGDPVGPARQRQVAVAIDHAGNESRAARIDYIGHVRGPVRLRPLVILRPDPRDPAVDDQDADSQLQPVRPAVGKSAIPIQRRSHVLETCRRRLRSNVPNRAPWQAAPG